MKIRMAVVLATLATTAFAAAADEPLKAKPRKKVLVELFTSQGCNSCPPANEFLGQLEKLGFGPDQVVPVAFHVDYFNEPWVDPFSAKDYSRRELAYNSAKKRNDLYFTPMMMVDGRYPMLGSNRPQALSSIRKALAEKPDASIRLTLDGSGPERTLKVNITPLSPAISGRELLVGVTVTEGPVSTKVPSGENAGKTLVEHHAARSFAFKSAKFNASDPRSFTFPVKLGGGSVAANCRVAAFVQDWDDGVIYQAESIPWAGETVRAR